MTHEEKIKYMQMACGLCGFGIGIKDLDLLVSMYEGISAKGGDFTVNDAVVVELEAKKREEASNAKIKTEGGDK